VHVIWSLTGYGYGLGWLLAVFAILALIVDAGRMWPPVVGPGEVVVESVPQNVGAQFAGFARRVAVLGAKRMLSVVVDSGGRLVRAVSTASQPMDPGTVQARLVAGYMVLCESRGGREASVSSDSLSARRVTRLSGLVATMVLGVGSVQVATALALKIGWSLNVATENTTSKRAWFAGLLDALSKWWDDLGGGGQGLVVVGAIAILIGVGLLLLPELVLGAGLGLAGGGLLGTTIVVPAGVGIGLIGGGVVLTVGGVAGVGTAGSGAGGDDGDGEEGGTKPGSGSIQPEVPPLRKAYVDEVAALSDEVEALRSAGKSAEEIARQVSAERRAIGIKYKDLTPPELLEQITTRNLEKYGDPLGPTVDWLRANGKTWEQIIESATRSGGKDLGF
jgi:hypothetical protein